MERVSELMRHILFHAEAEAAESDPSQVGNVRARIQYVRDSLADFKEDARKLDKYDLLREVSTAASPVRSSELLCGFSVQSQHIGNTLFSRYR